MTPENDVQAYKQRRAEEYCVGNTEGEPYSEYEGHFYKAGFDAGRELGRLEGELRSLAEGSYDDEAESLKEQIAALLRGEKCSHEFRHYEGDTTEYCYKCGASLPAAKEK